MDATPGHDAVQLPVHARCRAAISGTAHPSPASTACTCHEKGCLQLHHGSSRQRCHGTAVDTRCSGHQAWAVVLPCLRGPAESTLVGEAERQGTWAAACNWAVMRTCMQHAGVCWPGCCLMRWKCRVFSMGWIARAGRSSVSPSCIYTAYAVLLDGLSEPRYQGQGALVQLASQPMCLSEGGSSFMQAAYRSTCWPDHGLSPCTPCASVQPALTTLQQIGTSQ